MPLMTRGRSQKDVGTLKLSHQVLVVVFSMVVGFGLKNTREETNRQNVSLAHAKSVVHHQRRLAGSKSLLGLE